jgi:hypothetical protein
MKGNSAGGRQQRKEGVDKKLKGWIMGRKRKEFLSINLYIMERVLEVGDEDEENEQDVLC